MSTKLIDTSEAAIERAVDAVNDAMDSALMPEDYVDAVIEALAIPTPEPAADEVERVARCAYESIHNGDPWSTWEAAGKTYQDSYRIVARAAIAAMRQAKSEPPDGCVRVRVAVGMAVWRDMRTFEFQEFGPQLGHDQTSAIDAVRRELRPDGDITHEAIVTIDIPPKPAAPEVTASVEGGE